MKVATLEKQNIKYVWEKLGNGFSKATFVAGFYTLGLDLPLDIEILLINLWKEMRLMCLCSFLLWSSNKNSLQCDLLLQHSTFMFNLMGSLRLEHINFSLPDLLHTSSHHSFLDLQSHRKSYMDNQVKIGVLKKFLRICKLIYKNLIWNVVSFSRHNWELPKMLPNSIIYPLQVVFVLVNFKSNPKSSFKRADFHYFLLQAQ